MLDSVSLSSTPRSTLTRHRERGRTDRADLYAVLDAGLICHLGLVRDGAPVVLPTGYGRIDDTVYLHGSTGAGYLRAIDGAPDLPDRHPSRWDCLCPFGLSALDELSQRGCPRHRSPRHRPGREMGCAGSDRGTARPRVVDLYPTTRPAGTCGDHSHRLELGGGQRQGSQRPAQRRC